MVQRATKRHKELEEHTRRPIETNPAKVHEVFTSLSREPSLDFREPSLDSFIMWRFVKMQGAAWCLLEHRDVARLEAHATPWYCMELSTERPCTA